MSEEIKLDDKRCLITGKSVKETGICECKNCWEYICELEDAATCEHGFLVGCGICSNKANKRL